MSRLLRLYEILKNEIKLKRRMLVAENNRLKKEFELYKKTTIKLTGAEIQSGHSRVDWAEGLIKQLPTSHDGRNSWLLNYEKETK